MTKVSFIVGALLAALLTSQVAAHEVISGNIQILHPFLRATPPTAQVGSGYMVIRNMGTEPDRLIGIETTVADRVTLHQTVVKDGMATMIPIEGGPVIPAGGEYRLGSDGSHAMLEALSAPIAMGQIIEGTLIFEKAGRIAVTFEVEPAGTTQEKAMAGQSGG